MKAYLLFHLNLSFSSIDKRSHKSIIEKCYYPILHLAEQEKIKNLTKISTDIIFSFIQIGIERTMNFYNKKNFIDENL